MAEARSRRTHAAGRSPCDATAGRDRARAAAGCAGAAGAGARRRARSARRRRRDWTPPDIGGEPVLSHGDTKPEHFLLDSDDRLAWVIDWADACIAHPVGDLWGIVLWLGRRSRGSSIPSTPSPRPSTPLLGSRQRRAARTRRVERAAGARPASIGIPTP
ncbi:MAG: aminoglycoside phosphotransferase family protein [Gaiellaceae bacterium]